MSDLNLTSFNPLYPMRIHPYKELLNDSNVNIMDKVNAVIDYLNQVGKLTNDVVKDWNTVYQWVMNDGLTTDVNNKLEAMLANHEFDPIMNNILTKIGDLTTLQTVDKDTLVHAVNDLVTEIGSLNSLQTSDKSSIVNAINANVVSLAQIVSQTINVLNPPSGYTPAKGDGVTDDTNAIQSLLNAFGKVYLPATTQFYKITSPLTLNNNYVILGDGQSTKIKGFGTFNAIFQNVNGVTTASTVIVKVLMRGLNLLKDSSATIQFGIDTTNISYSLFDYVTVNGFSDSGILCNHTSANYNTLSNILTQNNTNDGIRLINNANTNRIYGITTNSNGRNGIRIDGGGVQSVETTEIIGGSIEYSGQSGIHVDGRGVLISGMHIEANSLNYAGYGISYISTSLTSNSVLGCYFFNNGNDTNHISHVQGITLTSNVQSVLAVYALGSPYQSYIRDGYLNMGSSGYVYVGDNTGMYNVSGEIWLQTSGSGKNLNLKGFGGFDAGIKLNGKVLYNADGSIVNAGKGTYFSSSIPSSGSYTQGDWVRNTVPTIQGTTPNRYIVKGWYRLTTGSTHVLNTDWWEERVSNGS